MLSRLKHPLHGIRSAERVARRAAGRARRSGSSNRDDISGTGAAAVQPAIATAASGNGLGGRRLLAERVRAATLNEEGVRCLMMSRPRDPVAYERQGWCLA